MTLFDWFRRRNLADGLNPLKVAEDEVPPSQAPEGQIVDSYRVPPDADPDASAEITILDNNTFGSYRVRLPYLRNSEARALALLKDNLRSAIPLSKSAVLSNRYHSNKCFNCAKSERPRTLLQEFVVYTTEAGSILLRGDEAITSGKNIGALLEKARELGATSILVTNDAELAPARAAGLDASLIRLEDKQRLDAEKLGLIVRSKLAPSEAAALEIIRQQSMAAAEAAIREASSRPDLHLVQAIQALDETDKHLNVVATRASEWYGLHFPELTQMMQDNVALCRLISEIGRREEFSAEALSGRGLTEKKVEAILDAATRSKGGEISDADMSRVKALASLAVHLSGEREKLNEYVDGAMRRISPNVSDIAGPTIGARLMAKAGGLDRLAVLPASTIQILGAEKALFRALRTGSRPPKHGILFQHQEVHMAPKWQRGKIARTLANKIAIAARVDYYRGTEDLSLKEGLDRRLERIKEKYKEPPRRPERQEHPQRHQKPRKRDGREKSRRR